MSYSHKILVAGAGIMGLSVAYVLRHALPEALITLSDPQGFPPKGSASAMAGGMLAPYSEIEYFPPQFLPAAEKSMNFWKNLPRDKTLFQQKGSLLLSHNPDAHMLARIRGKLPHTDGWRMVDGDEIAELEPELKGRFDQGLYIEAEALIHPPHTMEHLAGALSAHRTKEALVSACKSAFDWIVDCRGYGAAEDDPELRGIKGETVVLRNPDFSLSRPVRLMHPRYPLYIVPRPNHEFMIGATMIESADTAMTLHSSMELLSAAYSLHPSFGQAEILETLVGIRPAYADNLPRIKTEGHVIRCNGLFRHGFLLAPVMAECVADYILKRDNELIGLFMKGTADENHHQRTGKKVQSAV